MDALSQVFARVLVVSWQASVLVLLVLLAQGVFGRWLTARGRAVLWLLVTARLLVPVSPASVISLFNVARPEAAAPMVARWFSRDDPNGKTAAVAWANVGASLPALPSGNTHSPPALGTSGAGTSTVVTARQTSPDWWVWAAGAWALGGCVLGARLFWRNARFIWRLRQCCEVSDAGLLGVFAACHAVMGIRWRIRLLATTAVSSPALYGLVRPRLLVPVTMIGRLAPEEWRFVFLHELAHLKRWDVTLHWAMSVLMVVHWFNPVVWLAFRRMRQDRELACDELVLSKARGEENERYGEAILKVLEYSSNPGRSSGLVGILETRSQLERRIRMIATFNVNTRSTALVGVLLVLLGLATLTDARNKPGATEVNPSPSPAAGADKVNDQQAAGSATADLTDETTGLAFRVTKTITGTSDIIEYDYSRMRLSPNGKFLLWNERLVPLDGSEPVTLNELKGVRAAAWSPDGGKIAFVSEGVSVLPLSSETGHPTGPARKLLDGGPFFPRVQWSADSQRVLVVKWNDQARREAVSVDLRDGHLEQDPDYVDFGLVSPDGKTVAYWMPQDGIWTRPRGGGIGRIALPSVGGLGDDLVLWTPDSQWIAGAAGQPAWHTEELRLARAADGHLFRLLPPSDAGSFIGRSKDGTRLCYYRCSLEPRVVWKVFPAAGGSASRISPPDGFGALEHHLWSADSQGLAALSMSTAGDTQQMWFIPITGTAVRSSLVSLGTNAYAWSVSPDHGRVLYLSSVGTNEATARMDFHIAPISLKEKRVTAPSHLVFEGWRHPDSGLAGAWSPDGTKIAMPHRGKDGTELWLLSADGGKRTRLSQTPDRLGGQIRWSPDSKSIAFNQIAADRKMVKVIDADGGTAKTILTTEREYVPLAWSRDSKDLIVACDGAIASYAITDGRSRVILRLPDTGCDSVSWLDWSPNGQYLAFYGGKQNELNRLCVFSPSTGKTSVLGDGLANRSLIWTFDCCSWSPDSRTIACATEEAVRARPAGVVRELDLTEVIKKATPPTGKGLPAPREAPTTEPNIGPVFSDGFDDGPSQHWRFQDLPDTGWGPGRHAVQNGELVLSHARACLDVNSWSNYIVTVRVCLKEVLNPAEGNFGIAVRSTPSRFGSSRRDRYNFGVFGDTEARRYFWLGINYADASDTLRHGALSRAPGRLALDKWYTLELEVRGQRLRGYLDGKVVVESKDDRLTKGGLWIGTSGSRAHFDDFTARHLP